MGRIVEHDQVPERPLRAPSRLKMLGEVRSVGELARLLMAAPSLRDAPRGDGRVVVCSPGYLAPETSMTPMRQWLRFLGHDARNWGQGRNHGHVPRLVVGVIDRVTRLVADSGRPVDLVGWSLGGVVSREVARERPDLVRRVVTYGSPLVGGGRHTVFAPMYDDETMNVAAERAARRDAERPLQVPVTAIWTRQDGIAHWQACVDRTTPNVTNVEVGSTHLGLGLDPDVWRTVAEALAPGE